MQAETTPADINDQWQKFQSYHNLFKNVDQNIKTVLPLVLNAQRNEKIVQAKIYLVHYIFIIRNTENFSIYFFVKAYQVVQILLLFFHVKLMVQRECLFHAVVNFHTKF